jgi:putative inorganic carbon (hco3(-)) transporter
MVFYLSTTLEKIYNILRKNIFNTIVKALIPHTPLNGVLLVLLIMVLVSAGVTPDLQISLGNIIGILIGVGIFFFVFRIVKNKKSWMIIFYLFHFSGFLISIISLWLTSWHLSKFGLFQHFADLIFAVQTILPVKLDTFHPNIVAGTLLWFIPSLISFELSGIFCFKTIKKTKINILKFALIGFVILFEIVIFSLTLSRSAYIGFLISVLTFLFFLFPRKWWVWLSIIILMFVVIFGLLANTSDLNGSVSTNPSTTSRINSIATFRGRIELWSTAVIIIKDYPMTGIGMNTFSLMIHSMYPINLSPEDYNVGHAHNELLQAALDLGIPGLVGFAGLYIILFKQIWRRIRLIQRIKVDQEITNRFHIILISGLGSSLMGHFIYGLTDAVALGTKPSVVFFVLAGLICTFDLLVKNDSEKAV